MSAPAAPRCEEAAQKVKLPVVTYDVDRSGRDPGGKLVANLPHAGEVITAAFASDVGVDNDPIDGRRRLHLVRRGRHYAGARSHARRSQRPGRGALARGRDRLAAEDQGGRSARQAQGRQRVRRARQSRRSHSRRPPTSSSAASRAAACPPKSSARYSTPPRTLSAAPKATSRANGSCSASPT